VTHVNAEANHGHSLYRDVYEGDER
jgi:hypothetical protein